jgi:hypothetical protein
MNFVLRESIFFHSRPNVNSVVVIEDVSDLDALEAFRPFNLLEEEALDGFVILGAVWFRDDGFLLLAHLILLGVELFMLRPTTSLFHLAEFFQATFCSSTV